MRQQCPAMPASLVSGADGGAPFRNSTRARRFGLVGSERAAERSEARLATGRARSWFRSAAAWRDRGRRLRRRLGRWCGAVPRRRGQGGKPAAGCRPVAGRRLDSGGRAASRPSRFGSESLLPNRPREAGAPPAAPGRSVCRTWRAGCVRAAGGEASGGGELDETGAAQTGKTRRRSGGPRTALGVRNNKPYGHGHCHGHDWSLQAAVSQTECCLRGNHLRASKAQ